MKLVGLLCLFAAAADASISSSTPVTISFTNRHEAETKAIWSETNHLTITSAGLGWDGEPAATREGWIQTKPVGVGLAWRPTAGVNLRVRIEPAPQPIKLNSGQTYTPYFGRVFARYSPDARHWSSWHELRQDGTNSPTVHQGSMAVTRRAQQRFAQHRSAYAKLNVPWPDDTEACVRWLLQREPDFFATELPFIGYVEFLIEGSFHGGQRIRSFDADISWVVSGMHQPPKDGQPHPSFERPWQFKAP